MYNAAKVISDYLRPSHKNEYSMNDKLKFLSMLSSIPPLEDDKEDVSRVFESLFTNIPIEETITILLNKFMFMKSWHQLVQNWFSEDCR